MRKQPTLMAAIIVISMATLPAHADSQAGVRLDLPPGYLAAKPSASQATPAARASDDCPTDCVNFDAGYAWAEARRFAVETQCRGRSRPFVEGCMTYVVERRKCAGTCR
jgi:hypothetical protein